MKATWETAVEKVSDKYEDFDAVVGNLVPNNPVTVAIMEAENAGELAYYLAKNPTEAMRIVNLHPRAAIREIGKLEAKLLAEPAKAKSPSRAPAPITPLTGASPSTAKSLSDPDLPYEEFVKIREKQLGRRR